MEKTKKFVYVYSDFSILLAIDADYVNYFKLMRGIICYNFGEMEKNISKKHNILVSKLNKSCITIYIYLMMKLMI